MFDFYLDPLFWVLTGIFFTQLYIYLFLYRRLAVHKPDCSIEGEALPVSVIITAKNEAENLTQNLPIILSQDYPDYEVILVNDQSYDQTGNILEELSQQYPHLKVITIKEHIYEFEGKKFALTLAFKAAGNNIFLLTDADCKPESDQWIRLMQKQFIHKDTEIVLGYSPYKYRPGLLNLLIRFETLCTAMQYLSLALAGRPYMGVGRNLAYRKSTFFDNKGFAPYLKINSGDDDLFVNKNATKNNTVIQICPVSFIQSEPKTSYFDWLRQKKRHQRTGKLYKSGDKYMLAALWFSGFLFYAALIVFVLLKKEYWVGATGIFALRFIIQLIIIYLICKKLKGGLLWLFFPFLEVFYTLIYQPLLGLNGLRKNKKRNNGW